MIELKDMLINDDEAHDSVHKYGGHGVISVTSNVIPAVMKRLMDK
jgi:4-hydroxy-tetrahydrodipicolinate synthase